MNRFILFAMLSIGTPCLVNAQKHAPRPVIQPKLVPGIYPEGSKRLLRVTDIQGLNKWDLKVMRNEIFARHGYIFKTQEMKDYFGTQPWYAPRYANIESMLSDTEKKNVKFIQSYE
jgi:hypothetical protein